MKLIIKEYLASLNERDELDAMLPDLLSQMGLNVFSRPGRGTRQDGVDVAAVGRLDGGDEKVYLLSIKAGDLTRSEWDGDAVQSLRPSLNEILDSYIPNRLPDEHQDKEIVICICVGGEIREQVRPAVKGFIENNIRDGIEIIEWNGDRLAAMILEHLMSEELMPVLARSQFRKSLALLDEPDASFRHFADMVRTLCNKAGMKAARRLTAIRQINICVWILFAWARNQGNIEAAYLSSEYAILHAWEMAKAHTSNRHKTAKAIQACMLTTLSAYHHVSQSYLHEKVLPHAGKRHGLSVAVRSSCSLDVKLRMFDVLGRLALGGIWAHWIAGQAVNEPKALQKSLQREIRNIVMAIKQLIVNNTTLMLPVKDDHAIDIAIAIWLLMLEGNSTEDIKGWLNEVVKRATFAYKVNGQYPCVIHEYRDLLVHPQAEREDYLRDATGGSILFPMIAIWAAVLKDEALYRKVQDVKRKPLKHCNFQVWYPDEESEDKLYTNKDSHGTTLSGVAVERSMKDLLDQVFAECERVPSFETLSAVKYGLWPIILIACRIYRIPVPLHLWKPDNEADRSSKERGKKKTKKKAK